MLNSERVFNCYHPGYIRPIAGNPKPWLDYMEHLIPDEIDRELTLKWIATLIAHPGIRMTYSVLLISEKHGVGKTTLGEKILAPILGKHNCSFPNEKDIVESAFNSWIARKRLAVVSEIYAGQSSKAYQNLKHIIADKDVTVNEKYSPAYTISNWLHVLASSNSIRALKLQNDDRRWLVPRVTESLKPIAYWKALNEWLRRGGLSHINQWAIDYCEKNGPVKEGEHAPLTARKVDVIEEGYSPGTKLVRDYLMTIEHEAKEKNNLEVWTTDALLQDHIRIELHNGRYVDYLERPLTIRKIAEALGWHCGEKNGGAKAIELAPYKHRVISLSPTIAMTAPNKLAELGLHPLRPEGL